MELTKTQGNKTIAVLKHAVKEAIKRMVDFPLTILLGMATRFSFIRNIVENQQWFRIYRSELEARFQSEKEALKEKNRLELELLRTELETKFQEEKCILLDEQHAVLDRLWREGILRKIEAKVTIVCLLYQSPDYAKYFYENLCRHTPELQSGEACLLFVANDATKEMIEFLRDNKYPFIEHNNPNYSLEELNRRGYAWPEYIAKVYGGYNCGIRSAKTPEIVLMNSDNYVSSDWLYNLRKRLDKNHVVSPVLVQPHEVFPNPINGSQSLVMDFGRGLDVFKKNEPQFIVWAETIKRNTVGIGNAFMPLLLYKWQAELAGCYPQGNIADDKGNIKFSGDTYFFKKLDSLGITHINSNDSVVYHLQEGEKYNK